MLKSMIVILIVLWLCLILIAGVNLYRHLQIGKQNTRIMKDYEDKSRAEFIFKEFHDSLDKDIAMAESLKVKMDKSFPLEDKKQNWLMLRISMVLLTVLTIITYWFYYKKNLKE